MLFQRFPNLPEWRQGVEELSHSWLTLLAWTREGLLLRNGIWTPPSPGVKYSRGGRKHPQLQIYGRKKIAQNLRNLGYVSSHKSNKGNRKQHNDFFVYFWIIQRELYLHNICCLLSTSHRVHVSCVVSLTNTRIRTGRKPCFHFIFRSCFFF